MNRRERTTTAMRILQWFGIAAVALVAGVLGIGIAARVADGPLGPFPGGELRSGDLVAEQQVDWSLATGGKVENQGAEPLFVELQLAQPLGSRTTGVLFHEGELYLPCDLGFVWRRVPAPARWMLSLIYRLKSWHEHALLDGRVVVRIRGKRYERRAVRVSDPALLTRLRAEVERGAAQMFGRPLGPAPAEPPNDIWFFRLEARPST